MILTNANIVLTHEVIRGTIHVKQGRIDSIDQGHSEVVGAIDCAGDFIVPGLVELHTDNMEKYFSPRPGVAWPSRSAFKAHDAQMIAAGITTVFDAVSIGDVIEGSHRLKEFTRMIDSLQEARQQGWGRADHRLHLRCEVSHAETLNHFNTLIERVDPQLVSLMDHSPGQRQYADINKYRVYFKGKYNFTDEALEGFIERQIAASAQYSDRYRKAICEICHTRDIPLASHDDATVAHVAESIHYQMSIAEFPTTLEAASAAHQQGMMVLMGAPNVIRGGSHSGNIAAHVLANEGLLDALSSDYYPASLLESAFQLAASEQNMYDLPQAISLVSSRPADAVGLTDRGRIEVGGLADLLWVDVDKYQGVHLEQVWKEGRRVY